MQKLQGCNAIKVFPGSEGLRQKEIKEKLFGWVSEACAKSPKLKKIEVGIRLK